MYVSSHLKLPTDRQGNVVSLNLMDVLMLMLCYCVGFRQGVSIKLKEFWTCVTK